MQPWFDSNRGVASGIALSGTGLGTLLMPLLARWLIDREGWRAALTIIGLAVAGFGFVASNWIRRPPGLPTTSSSPWSHGSLRKLAREPSFQRLYMAGFLSSLVLLVPIVHLVPHAVRAGVAARDAAWLISILGFGSLAGRLMLGHAADRLGRQRVFCALHVALGLLFLTWTVKVGFITLALFAFAYGVCYGATIALRPAVIADHFSGPNLGTVTGLHYTIVNPRARTRRTNSDTRAAMLPDNMALPLLFSICCGSSASGVRCQSRITAIYEQLIGVSAK